MSSRSLYWSVDCPRPKYNNPGYCFLVFITVTKENQLTQYYADEILDRKELQKANCCHKPILLTLGLMAL